MTRTRKTVLDLEVQCNLFTCLVLSHFADRAGIQVYLQQQNKDNTKTHFGDKKDQITKLHLFLIFQLP